MTYKNPANRPKIYKDPSYKESLYMHISSANMQAGSLSGFSLLSSSPQLQTLHHTSEILMFYKEQNLTLFTIILKQKISLSFSDFFWLTMISKQKLNYANIFT